VRDWIEGHASAEGERHRPQVSAVSARVFTYIPSEIIEDTNEVAIEIGRHKLAQLPRFVLRLVNDHAKRPVDVSVLRHWALFVDTWCLKMQIQCLRSEAFKSRPVTYVRQPRPVHATSVSDSQERELQPSEQA